MMMMSDDDDDGFYIARFSAIEPGLEPGAF